MFQQPLVDLLGPPFQLPEFLCELLASPLAHRELGVALVESLGSSTATEDAPAPPVCVASIFTTAARTGRAVQPSERLRRIPQFGLQRQFPPCAYDPAGEYAGFLFQILHLLKRQYFVIRAVPNRGLGQQVQGDGVVGIQESRASRVGRV